MILMHKPKLIFLMSGKNSLILFTLIIFTVTSCLSTKSFEKQEESLIQDYLKDNPDLNFELKPSGLYYLETVAGTGPAIETYDTAYIFYTAKYLSNERIFSTNIGTTDTLISPIGGYLLEGFEEGVSYMSEGGESLLIVPSYLGYGQSGYYFPAYTPILYEVSLVKIVRGI